MNKKLLVVSILAVFMLVAISFASAVSSNTTTDEKRESPLFRIRTRKAIGERLGELKDTIRSRFIGERVFFLPFQWLRNGKDLSVRRRLGEKTQDGATCGSSDTCNPHHATCDHGHTCY